MNSPRPVAGLQMSALEGECAPFHALDGPTANKSAGKGSNEKDTPCGNGGDDVFVRIGKSY